MILSKETRCSLLINRIPSIILLAFFLTISSLFWTTDTAYTHDDLASLEFGWPITFLEQNFDRRDPPAWFFPHDYSLSLPQEYSSMINYEALLFSWLINSILLFLIFFLLCTSTSNIQLFSRFLSVRWILGIFFTLLLCLIIFLTIFSFINKPPQIHNMPVEVQMVENIDVREMEVLHIEE